MASVVADTHVAIWYVNAPEQLSSRALRTMQASAGGGDSIILSAISIVEIIYLVDKGKLESSVLDGINALLSDQDSGLIVVPVHLEVARTVALVPREQVPDMPDRIIAATALTMGLPLVTRDAQIQASLVQTIW